MERHGKKRENWEGGKWGFSKGFYMGKEWTFREKKKAVVIPRKKNSHIMGFLVFFFSKKRGLFERKRTGQETWV